MSSASRGRSPCATRTDTAWRWLHHERAPRAERSRDHPAGGRRRAHPQLEAVGPYLAERQWGTVREDYSPDGTSWDYFPHDHARSRAYRWGEDGLLGITDREGRLCFAL